MTEAKRDIREELASAISFAIRLKTFHVKKGKLTESQCSVECNC